MSFKDTSGKIDEEQIGTATPTTIATTTRKSSSVAIGTAWSYQKQTDGTVLVTNHQKGTSFTLVRCSAPPSTTSSITERTSYPPTGQGATSSGVGPSFDCTKTKDPVALIICSDPQLRELDLAVVRPYYILRYAFPNDAQTLKVEAINFQKALMSQCGILPNSAVTAEFAAAKRSCVFNGYAGQMRVWEGMVRSKLAGEALAGANAEISRPISDLPAIQSALKSFGFLPNDAIADGVYGTGTRQALMRAQSEFGYPQQGFADDATVRSLLSKGGAPVPTPPAAPAARVPYAAPTTSATAPSAPTPAGRTASSTASVASTPAPITNNPSSEGGSTMEWWMWGLLGLGAFGYYVVLETKKAEKDEEEFKRLSPEEQREKLIELRQQAITNCHHHLADAEERGDTRDIARWRGKIASLESELRRLGA